MSTVQFLLIGFVVAMLVVIVVVVIGWLALELLEMRKRLKKYKGIDDVEAEQSKVKAVTDKLHEQNKHLEVEQATFRSKLEAEQIRLIGELESEQARLKGEEGQIRDTIANLSSELESLERQMDINDYGLYEPKYDFGSSERYTIEIDNIRQHQKQMIQDKKAVMCSGDWTVSGSRAQGQKMVDEQMKLMLRAFNGECDALILKVKYDNVGKAGERIKSLYDTINKLGKTKQCWINQEYFDLKIKELHLVHEYQEKLYAEKEEQRQIREQMRQEEIARREIEKAQQDAEKQERQYEQALEQARREMELATGLKHDKLEAEIQLLQQRLTEAQEQKLRAMSRAQMTRSGHVYVISNIGSFGENVYKIGMTRRLVPEERVQELGDASVPFPFDIHAMIYCEDAPSLENKLHNCFNSRSINRINPRKEFFRVSLDEIQEVVHQNHGQIEFTLIAQAEEYRKTEAIIAQNGPEKLMHAFVN